MFAIKNYIYIYSNCCKKLYLWSQQLLHYLHLPYTAALYKVVFFWPERLAPFGTLICRSPTPIAWKTLLFTAVIRWALIGRYVTNCLWNGDIWHDAPESYNLLCASVAPCAAMIGTWGVASSSSRSSTVNHTSILGDCLLVEATLLLSPSFLGLHLGPPPSLPPPFAQHLDLVCYVLGCIRQ